MQLMQIMQCLRNGMPVLALGSQLCDKEEAAARRSMGKGMCCREDSMVALAKHTERTDVRPCCHCGPLGTRPGIDLVIDIRQEV